jgi:hypothetical protein
MSVRSFLNARSKKKPLASGQAVVRGSWFGFRVAWTSCQIDHQVRYRPAGDSKQRTGDRSGSYICRHGTFIA